MKINNSIPAFIINLKKRKDRKEHILREFKKRGEFIVKIEEAVEHEHGALGLWITIGTLIKNLDEKEDFILICEDDHQFTDFYSAEILFQCIADAKQKGADILLGGVSWLSSTLEAGENLFWVENFSGLQFTVIFRKFFKTILEASFEIGDEADYKLSSLTNSKFFIYPFISTQKEFGYSDITIKNDMKGHVNELFKKSDTCAGILKSVSKFYKQWQISYTEKIEPDTYESMTVSTYLINNLPDNIEHLTQIKKEFDDKKEFDVTIIDSVLHENVNINKWLNIRKIIELALKNDDDLIIISEDDHVFTENYSKEFLFRNIIEAHEQGADYLSGGAAFFNYAMPISENRFWIDPCLSSSFFVVYKRFFSCILDEPSSKNRMPERTLSTMTSSKMLLYPFISRQKSISLLTNRFGKENTIILGNSFENAEKRLRVINEFNVFRLETKQQKTTIV